MYKTYRTASHVRVGRSAYVINRYVNYFHPSACPSFISFYHEKRSDRRIRTYGVPIYNTRDRRYTNVCCAWRIVIMLSSFFRDRVDNLQLYRIYDSRLQRGKTGENRVAFALCLISRPISHETTLQKVIISNESGKKRSRLSSDRLGILILRKYFRFFELLNWMYTI